MIRYGVRQESADYKAEAGDVVQIETQYDERRGTVLYVNVNGQTIVRIQNLERGAQIANVKGGEVVPYTIDMNGRAE
jgi:hypothetical protein